MFIEWLTLLLVYFCLLRRVRSGTGPHPTSYSMGTKGSCLVCKSVTSFYFADSKIVWSCTSTPPYVFIVWYLMIGKDVGRNGLGLLQGTILAFVWRDWGRPKETSGQSVPRFEPSVSQWLIMSCSMEWLRKGFRIGYWIYWLVTGHNCKEL
jgi:hypothetical protein